MAQKEKIEQNIEANNKIINHSLLCSAQKTCTKKRVTASTQHFIA